MNSLRFYFYKHFFPPQTTIINHTGHLKLWWRGRTSRLTNCNSLTFPVDHIISNKCIVYCLSVSWCLLIEIMICSDCQPNYIFFGSSLILENQRKQIKNKQMTWNLKRDPNSIFRKCIRATEQNPYAGNSRAELCYEGVLHCNLTSTIYASVLKCCAISYWCLNYY